MALPLPRPDRDDVFIAGVGLVGGLVLWALGLHPQAGRPLGGAWVLVPLAATAGLELVRRSRPHLALLAGTLALAADQLTVGSLATVLMFTDLVYASVRYGSQAAAQRIPVGAGLLSVTGTICSAAWYRTPDALLVGVAIGLVAFAPATTGALVRNYREAAESARLRAEQTTRLAELDRNQAVAAERARMARELHDMVANRLSAIAIHSTAALSRADPEATRAAMAVIRENSVDGLAEMRRLIGLLRDSSGAPDPAAVPALDGLPALVDGARANGLEVTVHDTRTPGRELPTPVELAAYRITQESLTNALKHAVPGRVSVALAEREGALTVRVTSPYGERPAGLRVPGSGSGLVGMRERAALLNGSFHAGPASGADGRVWQVYAVLPTDEEGAL
ncbi:sensor histidine kinase [Streptomyces sp. NPDC092296]|uniref:sensor histidine kinase n=1 Tax=Streptomyces sp. NPDC092296 TaxID=3366012 RepID=UPI003828A252